MSSVTGHLLETALPSRRSIALARNVFGPLAILADATVIMAVAILTGMAYHTVIYGESGDIVNFLEAGALAAAAFVLPNIPRGDYALHNYFSFKAHFRRSLYGWHLAFLCLLTLGFLAKTSAVYSRGAMLLFYAVGFPAIVLMRYAVVQAVIAASRRGLVTAQRVFLVGTEASIAGFIERYQPSNTGIRIVGSAALTEPLADKPDAARLRRLRLDLFRAVETARPMRPDCVFVITPWSNTSAIDECVKGLMTLPAEIHLGPERILDRFENMTISRLGPIATLQLTRKPLSPLEVLQKRVFDLVLASGVLIALTPLLVVIAVLIKLDSPGPVFFLQRRYGFNQRPFRIFKFRTMTTADDGDVVVQAKRGDARVTRLGKWLREWSIDELPQLLNVISGSMSLVGPRPHALSHNREYEQKISLYARRHNVKPGITGWAQVNGLRGETDTDEKMRRRVEHDLYYIDNWSLWFDVRILARTLLSHKAHRNAV